MANDEIKIVLEKLVSVTEFLAEEVADLVDDRANRTTRDYVPGIKARADEIRAASAQLRTVFDEYQSSQAT
jgi:hypothetical protein